jgi:hypothetical protein
MSLKKPFISASLIVDLRKINQQIAEQQKPASAEKPTPADQSA